MTPRNYGKWTKYNTWRPADDGRSWRTVPAWKPGWSWPPNSNYVYFLHGQWVPEEEVEKTR